MSKRIITFNNVDPNPLAMKAVYLGLLLICGASFILLLSSSTSGHRQKLFIASEGMHDTCMVETFDQDPFANASWLNTGINPWTWTATGTAEGGSFWNDTLHQPVQSPGSDPRAIVFNSDSLASAGIAPPHLGIAESSFFTPETGLDSVFLSFHQYFRNFSSSARVEVLNFQTDTWDVLFTNQLDTNIETSHKQQVIIPLPSPYLLEIATEGSIVQFRFVFEGSYYFWIIDEVKLCLQYPFPQTLPPYIGDSLAAFGYDYTIDCFGGAVIPNQMIVQFSPSATAMQMDSIRNMFGVTGVDSCQCGRLEQWTLPTAPGVAPGLPGAGSTLGPFGQSTDLNELKKSMNAVSEIDGADLNRYLWNDLMQCPPDQLSTIDAPTDIPANGQEAVLIAFLDSGIDRLHPALRNQIWLNAREIGGTINVDDDGSCEPDDYIGWNFIGLAPEEVNNPSDNSCVGHGSRVAGIINMGLADSLGTDEYKLLPLKTHNREGVGNLFDALCAHYYAIEQGAKVINDSWGYYSLDSSEVLLNMIDTALANNVLIVAAAGNDTIDLDTLQQYPACVLRPNVVTVASVTDAGGDFELSKFSNHSNTFVDIGAPGEKIVSTIPGGGTDESTGTSFSAPAVAALAGYYYQQLGSGANIQEVLANLFNCVERNPNLSSGIIDGRVLSRDSCLPVIVNTVVPMTAFQEDPLELSPNPVAQQLTIKVKYNMDSGGEWQVHNVIGQKLWSQPFDRLAAGLIWQIDVGNWGPGVYFVSLQQESRLWSGKIIKY